MHGVCADALNAHNRPTWRQLRALGADAVRLVFRSDQQFYAYCADLRAHGIELVIVFAGESFETDWPGGEMMGYAPDLATVTPSLILLGNEPNAEAGAASSWVMTPADYALFWNGCAPILKSSMPATPIYVGGMLGGAASTWMETTWGLLSPQPDGIDVHYPTFGAVLLDWSDSYGVPVSCHEWAWVGRVSQKDFTKWVRTLDELTTGSSIFSWGYDGDDHYGLVGPSGQHRKAWLNYHVAVQGAA